MWLGRAAVSTAVWASSRAAVDERKVQVCCLQPAAAQVQVAVRGDFPVQQNRRSSTIKENATQCKKLHYVIYMDSNRVLVSYFAKLNP